MRDSVRALFQIRGIFHYFRAFKTEILYIYWIVPENIRTPTTGGIEILPPPMRSEIPKCSTPHVFGIPDSSTLPLFRNSRGVFNPFRISYSIYLTPPDFFFGPLKKMQCILNLNS